MVQPIRTREETEYGYIIRLDYGPRLGVTEIRVHRAEPNEAERAQVRADINRGLLKRGYRLAD